MTFEEKSGQYSLFECIKLTEEKYQLARPQFVIAENAAFAALLAQVKAGWTAKQRGRIVMDVTFPMRGAAVTGVERVALELARAFLALADKSELALVFTALKGDVFELVELDAAQAAGQTLHFRSCGKPLAFEIGDQLFIVEIQMERLDGYFNAISKARRAGAVANLMIHDLIWIVNTAWVDQQAAVQFLVKWTQVLRFADRVIAVSRKVARDIACYTAETSMLGLTPTRKLPVAWCSLGCDPFPAEAGQAPPLNFPVDRNTLIAVGTFTTRKGLMQLLKAMQNLWAEGSDAKLVFIGKDLGAGNTRKFLASQPEFNQKLFLPGYVSDASLNHALQQCGALVCPSLEEGFGLPLVEAAARGCPVIARDIEIFRETSGGTAFFFENGEADKIADGLRKWFTLTRKQQMNYVPGESLVTWRQSAEMLKAVMFQGAASFSLDVGIKATVNLAVPDSGRGIA
ncbi:MAG: glycosyltransferase family 1 protein [Aestuariivirga sp.]